MFIYILLYIQRFSYKDETLFIIMKELKQPKLITVNV